MNSGNALLRRYEDDLNVCGTGVIILGAWGILKAVIMIFLNGNEWFDFDFEATEDAKTVAYTVIIAIIVILIALFALIFLLHYYIGRNASRAAKGEPYKKGYYAWAIILLILSILGMFGYVDELRESENLEITLAAIIVDITSIYILANVVIATNKIKNIKAEMTQG